MDKDKYIEIINKPYSYEAKPKYTFITKDYRLEYNPIPKPIGERFSNKMYEYDYNILLDLFNKTLLRYKSFVKYLDRMLLIDPETTCTIVDRAYIPIKIEEYKPVPHYFNCLDDMVKKIQEWSILLDLGK